MMETFPAPTVNYRPYRHRRPSLGSGECFCWYGGTVGQGSVVGAHAAVFKDVEPWTVVGGNPAKFIKKAYY